MDQRRSWFPASSVYEAAHRWLSEFSPAGVSREDQSAPRFEDRTRLIGGQNMQSHSLSANLTRIASVIAAVVFLSAFTAACSFISVGSPQSDGLKTLRRIDHVALNVRSLETSAAFYERLFGFTVINKWKGVWMVGNESMRIGLFEHPAATAIAKPDDSLVIAHVAFLTDQSGFDACVREIDQLGIPHEPVEDTGIAKSVFIRDPDGHELEITYYYQKQPKF
jgi:glyoxylase I family protein